MLIYFFQFFGEYINFFILFDLIFIFIFVRLTSKIYYISFYIKIKSRIRLPLFNIRNYSVWRPYFKKDGYYGVFIDQIIWR